MPEGSSGIVPRMQYGRPTVGTAGGLVAAVCPALNEAASVAAVVTDAIARFDLVIVVDDGSRDATADIASAAGAVVVRHPFNLGVGAALQTGFRCALRCGADVVVQIDADGQHPVDQVDKLLAALDGDITMVIGSRFLDGSQAYTSGPRGWAMRVLARRASSLTGQPMSDASSGFRAIARPLLDEFARDFPDTYLGDTFGAAVLARRHGYMVREVQVDMRPRQGGEPSTGAIRSAFLVARALASVSTAETRPKL